MRKTAFMLILAGALALSSCSMGGGDTPKDYTLPVFSEISKSSALNQRGLIDMPTGEVWDGEKWRSSGVMQALPVMIGYENVKKNNFNEIIEDANEKGSFNVLGFEVSPDTAVWAENRDGFTLVYDIYANGNNVGFIQYYYSFEEKVFSYRQMVMVTYIEPQTTSLISLEYNDIPVRNHNQIGRFEFGQLDRDGATEQNAFADTIRFNGNGSVKFIRSYLSGTSSKDLFASVFRPDMTYGTDIIDSPIVAECISEKDSNGNGLIDTREEASSVGVKFIYEVIREFYSNADNLMYADGNNKPHRPYRSYQEFKDASLEDVTFGEHEISRKEEPIFDGMSLDPVLYSWENSHTASATFTNPYNDGPGSTQGVFLDVTKATWDKTGFGHFYENLPSKVETDEELQKELIRRHLENCGLNNGNFIANFTYAALHKTYGRSTYWPYGITIEEHEVFKQAFEEAANGTTQPE